jgi:hypothetical protein
MALRRVHERFHMWDEALREHGERVVVEFGD